MSWVLRPSRSDELHTREENTAQTLSLPVERRIFPEGHDDKGRPYADLRWSRFKNFEPREMMEVVDDHVFPFLPTAVSSKVCAARTNGLRPSSTKRLKPLISRFCHSDESFGGP